MYFYKRRRERTKTLNLTGTFTLIAAGQSVNPDTHLIFRKLTLLKLSWNGITTGNGVEDAFGFFSVYASPELVDAGLCEDVESPSYGGFDYDIYANYGMGVFGADGQQDNYQSTQQWLVGQFRCGENIPNYTECDLTGSLDWRVEVEEWKEVLMVTPLDYNPATGYSQYLWHPVNGNSPPNPFIDGTTGQPLEIQVRYWEQIVPDSEYQASITIDGNTVSLTGTHPGSDTVQYSPVGECIPTSLAFEGDTVNPAFTSEINLQLNGVPLNFSVPAGLDEIDSLTQRVYGDSEGNLYFHLKEVPEGTFTNINKQSESWIVFEANPDWKVAVNGRIYGQNLSLYGENCTTHATYNGYEPAETGNDYPKKFLFVDEIIVGGVLTKNVSLQKVSVVARDPAHEDGLGGYYYDFGFYRSLFYIRDWQKPLGIGFDSKELSRIYTPEGTGWLKSKNFRQDAWRINLKDPEEFDGAILSRDSSYLQETFDVLEDWTELNGTKSLSGGKLRFEATAGSATIKKSIENAWNWVNWRKTKLKASASETATIKMVVEMQYTGDVYHTKKYPINLTTSNTEHLIDLLQYVEAEQSIDFTDNPVEQIEGITHPNEFRNSPQYALGDFAGVYKVWSIWFEVPEGVTVTFDTLTHFLDAEPTKICLQPAFETTEQWELLDDTYKAAGNCLLWSYTNLLRSMLGAWGEFSYSEYKNRRYPSVHELLQRFTEFPGWTVSEENETDDHADIGDLRDGETAYLNTHDFAAIWLALSKSDLELIFDKPCDNTHSVELKMQINAGLIDIYPLIGDPRLEAGDDNVYFPMEFVWFVPSSSQEGFVLHSDTKEPLANATVLIKKDTTSLQSLTTGEYGEYRSTVNLPTNEGEELSIETSVVLSAFNTEPKKWQFAVLVGEAEPSEEVLVLTGYQEKLGKKEIIYCLDPSSGKLKRYRSDHSLIEETIITDGKYPSALIKPDGREIVYFNAPDGSLKRVYSEDGFASWVESSVETPGDADYDAYLFPFSVNVLSYGGSKNEAGEKFEGEIYLAIYGNSIASDGHGKLFTTKVINRDASGWELNAITGSPFDRQPITYIRNVSGLMRGFFTYGGKVRSYVPNNPHVSDGGSKRTVDEDSENEILSGDYLYPSPAIDGNSQEIYLVLFSSGVLKWVTIRLNDSFLDSNNWSVSAISDLSEKIVEGDTPGTGLPPQKVALFFNSSGELRCYWWQSGLKQATINLK